MKLTTRNFGEIEVEQEKIIQFEEGLPGFEMLRQFLLIESEEGLFQYLQSVEDEEVCFVIMSPHEVMEEYAPVINESYFEKLGGGENSVFALYAVVCLREVLEESTINLAGPILIHTEHRKGIQVITEDRKYQTKHKLINLVNGVEESC